jgi:hypothetical protein
MRWFLLLTPVLSLVAARANEPAAAAAPGVTAVELGGQFAPGERSTVRWQTRTDLIGATYTGIRGIAPVEGKVDKTDEREVLTTYTPGGVREVLMVKGLSSQVATFDEKPDKKQKHQALEGVPVVGRQINGKWAFGPAIGEATEEQRPELERLARRANEEVDLFAGVKAKPGDCWDLDPVKFLKAAGFDDVTLAKGTCKATLKEVAASPAGPEAVIGLEIDVRAEQTPPGGTRQRMHVQYSGRMIRVLATRLDRRVELEGRMTLTGEVIADGQRSPFTLATPVKYQSHRELVKP